LVASFAEFERDLIRERVKAGIAHRRAKGLRVGREPVQIDRNRLQALRGEGLTQVLLIARHDRGYERASPSNIRE